MDPITMMLLGFGLNAISGTLGGLQKSWYQDALRKSEKDAYLYSMNERKKQLAIQDEFQRQADQYYASTKSAITPEQTEENRQDAEQQFIDFYDERGTTQPEGQYLSGQDATTNEVKQEIAKRAATAAADARTRVKALAKVGSFDDAMQANGLALQEQGNKSVLLNNIRRGSQAVSNQAQQIPANQVFPGNDLISPLLGAGADWANTFATFNRGTSGQQWAPKNFYDTAPKITPTPTMSFYNNSPPMIF